MYSTHVRGRSRSLLNVEAVLNSVSFAAPAGKQPAGRKADCKLIDFSGNERILHRHLFKFRPSPIASNRAFVVKTFYLENLEPSLDLYYYFHFILLDPHEKLGANSQKNIQN